MAQGKLKVKTKLPQNVKSKTQKQKGSAVTKRANKPMKQKKKFESHKLKQLITKTVNKAVEVEIRAKADHGPKNFSKAQLAVAEHHRKSAAGTSSQ